MNCTKLSKVHKYEFQQNEVVITRDLPIQWSCCVIGQTLKLTLLSVDPGFDKHSIDTEIEINETSLNFFQEKSMRRLLEKQSIKLIGKNATDIPLIAVPSGRGKISITFIVHYPKNSVSISGWNFLDPETKYDKILVVGEKKFYVQNALLSIFSPVFDRLFNGDFEEAKKEEIELNYVDPKEFEVLLQILYPTTAAIDGTNVEFLWKLADKFEIQCVVTMCENFLCEMTHLMTDSDGNKMLMSERQKIAMKYNSEKLMNACWKVMDDLKM